MKQIDVRKVADEARFNGFHAGVLWWCALVILVDGYDLNMSGVAMPSIMKELRVDAATAGLMASSALVGMMVGAAVLGALADKIGRRAALSLGVFLFSAFTALAGLTHDTTAFCLLRFVAGLGLGGVMPVLTAAMTECSPRKMRSLLPAMLASGFAVGGIFVALVGKQLLDANGWQSIFFTAGAALLLIPCIYKWMPESMPYLLARGDDHRIRQILRRMDPGLEIGPEVKFVVPAQDAAKSSPIASLFQDGRAPSTLLIWLAFIAGLFMVYALGTWLTKLLAIAGYSLGSALTFTIDFNVGAIVGVLLGGWLADRLNVKWVLATMWALAAVSLALMGQPMGLTARFVLVLVVGATATGTFGLAYAYAGQFYPMSIRSTGVGIASGVGRLGAIVAPVIIGFLVSLHLPLEQNFFAIGAAGVIAALAIACTKDRLSSLQYYEGQAREGELASAPTVLDGAVDTTGKQAAR